MIRVDVGVGSIVTTNVLVAIGVAVAVAVNDGPGVLVGINVAKVGTPNTSSFCVGVAVIVPVAVTVAALVKVMVAVRDVVKRWAGASSAVGRVGKETANAKPESSKMQSGTVTASINSRKIFVIESPISACDYLKYNWLAFIVSAGIS